MRCCVLFLLFLASVTSQDNLGLDGEDDSEELWTEFWLFRFVVMVLGYGSIIVPGYLLIKYVRSSGYLETNAGRGGALYSILKTCIAGSDSDVVIGEPGSKASDGSDNPKTSFEKFVILMICAGGLQVSYLTWGVLQERIMAHEYGKTDTDPGEKFSNSQFLVFVNRVLAFVTAGCVMRVQRPAKTTVPFYKYSYCSISNILSSWCQYEALKFVSFPTQVLAKASKVIPVMIMGKVVSGNVYEFYQYITALLISLGMSLFLLTQGVNDQADADNDTTFAGVIILVGYMSFDSFTSNWQGELFKTYKMSSIQMMFGVNFWSCLFTSWSLLSQGDFFTSLSFMFKHDLFLWHCVILSICSATGQLFIFQTISRFGPIVFVIIMTLRQMFAILLSCFIYEHKLGLLAWAGVMVVFCALFLEIYAKQRAKKVIKPTTPPSRV
jgi:adenosine 3'-phospho 5'-phosphosulfate transporter B2